jgi:hypothetical protein
VNTGVAKRDAQLKSADFFDVARYPVISVAVADEVSVSLDLELIKETKTAVAP